MKSTEELFTPEKVAMDALYQAMPATKFVASCKTPGYPPLGWQPTWHVGVKSELRYVRSGLISHVTYVTKCSGQQLGGAWGYRERTELPEHAHVCKRCFPNGDKS